MNKRQKIVQQQFLDNEEKVINKLKNQYSHALKEITGKSQSLYDEIEELTSVYDDIEDEAEKAVLKSRIQSKVYQKQYQDSLKKQVGDILDKMQDEEFKTVSSYLDKCYEEGFVGTLYDLQGQGIPLCFPLDQEAMVRAVQLDSKISQGLYSRLGEDVGVLKKKITAQVSRGIATGMTFKQVAQQISAYSNIGFNNAVRIARTEGHRIQCQSGMDACYKAKEKGADVVKQWDSTLDAKTRESHVQVDGEIRELDKEFSNGLMFPGDPSGGAAEVVNCRCALLQRARWAVGGSFTKMNNFTKQLETFESPEKYAEFKDAFFSKENRKYMNYVQEMEDKYGTRNFQKVLDKMNDREYKHYSKLLAENPLYNKNALMKTVHPTTTKQKPITTPKNYTKKDLDKMSVDELRKVAEKTAVQYYESGASGISFGDADVKDVARKLAQQGSATSLKKDILAMQKKMDKTLTNSGNSDKMHLKEGNKKPYTKVKVEDIPSMNESQFNTMKKNLEKKGVTVIQDMDGDDFLKAMGAEALTVSDGSAIIFQSGRIPSASAMFEETIHVAQIKKKGMIRSTGDKQGQLEYLAREIEANEKLIKHQKAYGLTEKDVESVQENLAGYYKELKEVEKNV